MNGSVVKNSEPVAKSFVWAGAAVLLIINGIALLQAFGVPITPEQGDATIKVVESGLALAAIAGGTWWARSQVTPVEKVEKMIIPATASAAANPSLTGQKAKEAGVEAGEVALATPPLH